MDNCYLGDVKIVVVLTIKIYIFIFNAPKAELARQMKLFNKSRYLSS